MNTYFRFISDRLASVGHSVVFRFRGLMFLGLVVAAASGPALAGSVAYTYDTLGRLSTATYGTGVVITYSYDAAGNRTSYVTIGAP